MNELELGAWRLLVNVLFLKTYSLIVIAKIVLINWLKYELTGFYDFTLRKIATGLYLMYRKQMKKCFFQK